MHLPSVQSLLKKYEIKPKKRLGQNFLIAQPTIIKIVKSLNLKSTDYVIEIGPGLGVMTAMISANCKQVYAVDADEKNLEIAKTEFKSLSKVDWILGDILKTDLSKFKHTKKMIVVGNIPYNISSPIFFHIVKYREYIERAVLMVQKEVADRIVAKPGGKEYGALGVMLQSYANCRKLFNVSRNNFIPPPKVTSSVVELEFLNGNVPTLLEDVVQSAFQKRRKTLRNAILGSKSISIVPDSLDRILDRLDIDPKRRPETLSVEEFWKLAEKIERQ